MRAVAYPGFRRGRGFQIRSRLKDGCKFQDLSTHKCLGEECNRCGNSLVRGVARAKTLIRQAEQSSRTIKQNNQKQTHFYSHTFNKLLFYQPIFFTSDKSMLR